METAEPDRRLADLIAEDGALFARGTLVAVLDGARIDDLPHRLLAAGVEAEPLYGEATQPALIEVGPQAVRVREGELDALLALSGRRRGAVWWWWEEEGDAAWSRALSHLRSLETMELPTQRHDNLDAAPNAPFERVLFRHADPDAFRQLWTVLHPAQRARLAGGAAAVLLDAPSYFGAERIEPEAGVLAPSGPLRIATPAQYAALSTAADEAMRLRCVEGVRACMPEQAAALGAARVDALVREGMASAESLGFAHDDTTFRWCCLNVACEGAVIGMAGLEAQFAAAEESPDALADAIYDEVMRAADPAGGG